MAASTVLWLLAQSSARRGGGGSCQGVDGPAHSWTEERVKQLNRPWPQQLSRHLRLLLVFGAHSSCYSNVKIDVCHLT